MIYVKINEALYPATIRGKVHDEDWDNRESKAINLVGDYETVNALFPDGAAWSIVDETTVIAEDENGKAILDENGDLTYTTRQTEYDNSEYFIRGDLIVHGDDTITVKMGKLTALEKAYEMMFGGIE